MVDKMIPVCEAKMYDERTSWLSRYVHEMLSERGMRISDLLRLMNEDNPNETQSLQNLTKKIKNGTMRLHELSYLAHILNYRLELIPEEAFHEKPKSATRSITDDKVEGQITIDEHDAVQQAVNEEAAYPEMQSKFVSLAAEGYTVVESERLGHIVVVGARAEEAAEFLRSNLPLNNTDAGETVVCFAANRQFGVLCKPAHAVIA